MATESKERVMAGGTTKLQSAGKGSGTGEDEAGGTGKQGKRKVLVLALVGVIVAAAAGWFFLVRGAPAQAEAEPAPKPGEVLPLESISVNLAGGHYLKVGLALQAVEGPAHAPDGSQALDIAIETFSGRDMAELASAEQRQAVKAELVHRVSEAYHGDVFDVYFTEFVMQ